jgi:hypothetical protein
MANSTAARAADLLSGLGAISLDGLEERAALLKRIDRKYVLEADVFEALIDRLAGDHDALEIDDRRLFAYRSVYFDTPDLRCFHDHIEDRQPRFKARTRLYRDTGLCHFEVKLKPEDGETDKRQTEHPPERAEELTDDARRLLAEALGPADIEPPDDLRAILRTCFDRATLAARDSSARVTCDVDIAMETLEGRAARVRDGLVLVESKSEDGDAPADRVLAELGHEPVSLSKYRVSIDLLVERDESGDLGAVRELFRVG